jgi:hypothetical protein
MMKTITALMVLTLIATISMGNAYAIEGDGTSHVEVDEYPFNITVEEGGSITIHNNGENRIDFVSYGWFEGTIPVNDAIALEFPVVNCGTTCFTEGMYYISDLNGGQQSTIEIVKPYVAPPPAPVVVEPTPEPIVEEQVDFGATSDVTLGSFESISDDAIFNVAEYEGNVDIVTLQTQLAEVTAKFNDSITKLADQKVAIENHNNQVQSLNTQIGTLNTTATSVTTLEQSILSLQQEKDELNATIASLGNTTATQLATIESLQSDTTLNAELESQIVTLTNANVTATETIAVLEQMNSDLRQSTTGSVQSLQESNAKIVLLEQQVVTLTNDRDQWKQLANSWYAVAMDQLKVMVDVLGL